MEQLEAESSGKEERSTKHSQPPSWISDSVWRQCQFLAASLPAFANVCRSIRTCPQQWQAFKTSQDCLELIDTPFVLGKCLSISSVTFIFVAMIISVK
jgi:hypothetical protein